MSTKFLSPSWRMPRNANQSKQSNYSLKLTTQGTGEYLDLGSSVWDIIKNSTGFTISIWCKIPTGSGVSQDFVPFYFAPQMTNPANAGWNSQAFWLSIGGGVNTLKLRNQSSVVLSYQNPPNDVWTHYVLSVEIGSDTSKQILY